MIISEIVAYKEFILNIIHTENMAPMSEKYQ